MELECFGCDAVAFDNTNNAAYYCRDIPSVLIFRCTSQDTTHITWNITNMTNEITLVGSISSFIDPVTVWLNRNGDEYISLMQLNTSDLQHEGPTTVRCYSDDGADSITVMEVGKFSMNLICDRVCKN